MHTLSSSFVLGYHGCDAQVAESILSGNPFLQSKNDYDWLGPGIYFWEANPRRGLDFATELSKNPRSSSKVKKPAVIGAVIEMGICLDLTTLAGISQVQLAHERLVEIFTAANLEIPKNNPDGLRRNLDCAVIRTLHAIREANSEPQITTVKGIFVEGEPLYPGSGFRAKTHVQLCVRDPLRIKGVFRVPTEHLQ